MRLRTKTTAHCHVLVKRTAQDMARALYEDLAKNNEFYRANPNSGRFVAATWPQLLSQARATLVELLNTNLAPQLKDEIAEALILDKSLWRGRNPDGSKVNGWQFN